MFVGMSVFSFMLCLARTMGVVVGVAFFVNVVGLDGGFCIV